MSDHLVGYTKSWRKKWANPVFRNLLEAGIWTWMCDAAAWKETTVRFNGLLVKLERGQLAVSVRFMAEGFLIGSQVINTFLKNLENAGMVTKQTNKHLTIITICNYNEYQSFEKTANEPIDEQLTNGQQTANTNKKERKNIINKELIIVDDGFDRFWNDFPSQRKGNKQKALSAYRRALTRTTEEKINVGLQAYVASSQVANGYASGAERWINNDGWTADYSDRAPRAGSGNGYSIENVMQKALSDKTGDFKRGSDGLPIIDFLDS